MAAGGSRRLGEPKQLLTVNGGFLINHMIRTIKSTGLDDLFIVLGYSYKSISDVITQSDVRIVCNPDWQEGISSSIRKGLNEITDESEAAIFFVVDQPFLTSELISNFLSHYEEHNPDIMATRVGDHLVHPVLFKRRYYDELKSLQGEKGGKQLFSQNEVTYFDWKDERLLIDIDTRSDLENFRNERTQSSSRAD